MSEADVDKMMAMIHAKVKEFGWMVTGVFATAAEHDKTPFAYTIGLTSAGLPELLISGGFDPATLQGFLNMAAKRHCELEIQPGDELDFLANVPFRVVKARVGDHVQQTLNYYRDPENEHGYVTLLQIIWPDRDGNFPDEPGWTGGDSQELFT